MGIFSYEELRDHIGHKIVCVGYGSQLLPPANVAVECETCSTVLMDFDKEDTSEMPPSVRVRRMTF